MSTFSLSSSRPMMTVDVDGEKKQLPLKPNARELASMAVFSDVDNTSEAESMAAVSEWFADFARPYIGSIVDECDGQALLALESEWFAQFNSANDTEGDEALGE